jgi:hypothetical protein
MWGTSNVSNFVKSLWYPALILGCIFLTNCTRWCVLNWHRRKLQVIWFLEIVGRKKRKETNSSVELECQHGLLLNYTHYPVGLGYYTRRWQRRPCDILGCISYHIIVWVIYVRLLRIVTWRVVGYDVTCWETREIVSGYQLYSCIWWWWWWYTSHIWVLCRLPVGDSHMGP